MYNLKHRPDNFSDFKGNESAVSYFVNTPISDWAKTHLVSGPSGIGKTTLARIVANKLADKTEIREIDSAQDRGIDKMRNLIRESYHRPLTGKNKVYIFDEFHQVTKDAQESLLKITEEPPKHLYFILCSTDPRKIKATIKNRCNLITLKEINDRHIALILKDISEKEKIEWTEPLKEIGRLIVQESDGIPRRAVMLFEKLKDYIDVEEARKAIGIIIEEDESLYPLFLAVLKGDLDGMIDNLPDENYESVRIAISRMLVNKIKKGQSRIKYSLMLSHFLEPIDDRLGDVNLIWQFTNLTATMEEYEKNN